jgi:hypothetical protein
VVEAKARSGILPLQLVLRSFLLSLFRSYLPYIPFYSPSAYIPPLMREEKGGKGTVAVAAKGKEWYPSPSTRSSLLSTPLPSFLPTLHSFLLSFCLHPTTYAGRERGKSYRGGSS